MGMSDTPPSGVPGTPPTFGRSSCRVCETSSLSSVVSVGRSVLQGMARDERPMIIFKRTSNPTPDESRFSQLVSKTSPSARPRKYELFADVLMEKFSKQLFEVWCDGRKEEVLSGAAAARLAEARQEQQEEFAAPPFVPLSAERKVEAEAAAQQAGGGGSASPSTTLHSPGGMSSATMTSKHSGSTLAVSSLANFLPGRKARKPKCLPAASLGEKEDSEENKCASAAHLGGSTAAQGRSGGSKSRAGEDHSVANAGKRTPWGQGALERARLCRKLADKERKRRASAAKICAAAPAGSSGVDAHHRCKRFHIVLGFSNLSSIRHGGREIDTAKLLYYLNRWRTRVELCLNDKLNAWLEENATKPLAEVVPWECRLHEFSDAGAARSGSVLSSRSESLSSNGGNDTSGTTDSDSSSSSSSSSSSQSSSSDEERAAKSSRKDDVSGATGSRSLSTDTGSVSTLAAAPLARTDLTKKDAHEKESSSSRKASSKTPLNSSSSRSIDSSTTIFPKSRVSSNTSSSSPNNAAVQTTGKHSTAGTAHHQLRNTLAANNFVAYAQEQVLERGCSGELGQLAKCKLWIFSLTRDEDARHAMHATDWLVRLGDLDSVAEGFARLELENAFQCCVASSASPSGELDLDSFLLEFSDLRVEYARLRELFVHTKNRVDAEERKREQECAAKLESSDELLAEAVEQDDFFTSGIRSFQNALRTAFRAEDVLMRAFVRSRILVGTLTGNELWSALALKRGSSSGGSAVHSLPLGRATPFSASSPGGPLWQMEKSGLCTLRSVDRWRSHITKSMRQRAVPCVRGLVIAMGSVFDEVVDIVRCGGRVMTRGAFLLEVERALWGHDVKVHAVGRSGERSENALWSRKHQIRETIIAEEARRDLLTERVSKTETALTEVVEKRELQRTARKRKGRRGKGPSSSRGESSEDLLKMSGKNTINTASGPADPRSVNSRMPRALQNVSNNFTTMLASVIPNNSFRALGAHDGSNVCPTSVHRPGGSHTAASDRPTLLCGPTTPRETKRRSTSKALPKSENPKDFSHLKDAELEKQETELRRTLVDLKTNQEKAAADLHRRKRDELDWARRVSTLILAQELVTQSLHPLAWICCKSEWRVCFGSTAGQGSGAGVDVGGTAPAAVQEFSPNWGLGCFLTYTGGGS